MTIIDERRLAGLPAGKRRLLEQLMARTGTPTGTPTVPTRRTGDPAAPVPATPAQARLWLRAGGPQAAHGTGAHALRLHGPLDPARLQAALAEVLGRHEALRTAFADGPDGPVQVVRNEAVLEMDHHDLTGTPSPERSLTGLQVRAAGRPLDLGSGATSRFTLVRIGPAEHVLLLAAHLAVFDGWSSAVLMRDLSDAYRGRSGPDPVLHMPDVASWLHGRLHSPVGTAAVDRIVGRLADAPNSNRPATGFVRAVVRVGLRPDVTRTAFARAAAEGATPFMTLVAALGIGLAGRQGDPDVVIGVPVAGRTADGLEGVIGQLTTVVPVRLDCSGRPGFRTVLARARIAVAEALAEQSVPVDTLHARLRADGHTAAPWSVLFALHNYPTVPLDLPDVRVANCPGPAARHLQLHSPDPRTTWTSIGLVEDGGVVQGIAEFNRLAAPPEATVGLLRAAEAVLTLSNDDREVALLPAMPRERRHRVHP